MQYLSDPETSLCMDQKKRFCLRRILYRNPQAARFVRAEAERGAAGIRGTWQTNRDAAQHRFGHQLDGQRPFEKKRRQTLRGGKIHRLTDDSAVGNHRPGNQRLELLLQPAAAR